MMSGITLATARARELFANLVAEVSLSSLVILLVVAQVTYFVAKGVLEYRVSKAIHKVTFCHTNN